ncbi:hypothetical protein WK13_11160 [Burkholderia ubonensis]|nr:hypothetical protein WK13_11160 [Burkholderia ubonensis]
MLLMTVSGIRMALVRSRFAMAVTMVHEERHKRARQQQQVQQHAKEVGAVFGKQQEHRDGRKG